MRLLLHALLQLSNHIMVAPPHHLRGDRRGCGQDLHAVSLAQKLHLHHRLGFALLLLELRALLGHVLTEQLCLSCLLGGREHGFVQAHKALTVLVGIGLLASIRNDSLDLLRLALCSLSEGIKAATHILLDGYNLPPRQVSIARTQRT